MIPAPSHLTLKDHILASRRKTLVSTRNRSRRRFPFGRPRNLPAPAG